MVFIRCSDFPTFDVGAQAESGYGRRGNGVTSLSFLTACHTRP